MNKKSIGDIRNPVWLRPDDWPLKEDLDSPAWLRKIERLRRKSVMAIARYGFFACPFCGAKTKSKVIFCLSCGYSPPITQEQHDEMDRIIGPNPA